VRDVFELPLVKGSGVAVVADRFWIAKQARDRLKIEWDLSAVEHADTRQLSARYKELARTPGNVAVSNGDQKAMDAIAAPNRLVVEYEFPYLAHSPMEPLNTTIRFDGNRAEAWVGSQFQTFDQIAIAERSPNAFAARRSSLSGRGRMISRAVTIVPCMYIASRSALARTVCPRRGGTWSSASPYLRGRRLPPCS